MTPNATLEQVGAAAQAQVQTSLKGTAAMDRAVLPELRDALAVANDNIKIIERALDRGKGEDSGSYRTFAVACAGGDEMTARSLLAKGLDVSRLMNDDKVTVLHAAACNGHLSVVRLLVEHGAQLGARLGPTGGPMGVRFAGATPWLLARANRRELVAEFLVSRGADPGVVTDGGLTAESLDCGGRTVSMSVAGNVTDGAASL